MVATIGASSLRAATLANMEASWRGPALALAAAALVLTGCYSFSQPAYEPGDQRDVLQAVTRRGIVVSEPMPGRSACSDPELVGNVLHLTARLPDEPDARDVYIHSYRERSWEDSVDEVDACQAEYAAAHPGSTVTRLDIPTFRVFGADWSPALARELRAAFEEAARAG
jgi:hypothetical protein